MKSRYSVSDPTMASRLAKAGLDRVCRATTLSRCVSTAVRPTKTAMPM